MTSAIPDLRTDPIVCPCCGWTQKHVALCFTGRLYGGYAVVRHLCEKDQCRARLAVCFFVAHGWRFFAHLVGVVQLRSPEELAVRAALLTIGSPPLAPGQTAPRGPGVLLAEELDLFVESWIIQGVVYAAPPAPLPAAPSARGGTRRRLVRPPPGTAAA